MPAAAHRTFAQCCSGLGWQRPHTSAAPVATATKKRATKVPHRGRPLSGGMPLPPPASATERRRSLSGRGQRLRRLPAGAQRARRSIDGHSPAGRRRRRRAPRRVLSATPGRGSQNLPEARHESPRRGPRRLGGQCCWGRGICWPDVAGLAVCGSGDAQRPRLQGTLRTPSPQRVGNWNRLGRTAVWRLAARPFSPRCKVGCSAFAAARHTRLAS